MKYLILTILIIFILFYTLNVKKQRLESFYVNTDNLKQMININKVSNYDGLYLQPEGGSTWRHSPSNVPLLDSNKIYIPQGNTINLKKSKNQTIGYQQFGPPVDDKPNSQKSLFTFAYNQCRPECCPSTYSCDRGCICTNESQRRLINKRGMISMPNSIDRPT